MPTRKAARTLSSLVISSLVLLIAPSPAFAAPGGGGGVSVAAEAARDLWEKIQQLRGEGDTTRARNSARPQLIESAGPNGPILDLSNLSDPIAIEEQLARLAALPDDDVRATIAGGGSARLGAFSIGSEQRITGNILIMKGNAEVFGHLDGNLVTYDGDIIVHPGAVISGDVLAVHGLVREQGGEIGGEIQTLSASARTTRAAAPPLSATQLTLRRLAGVVGVFLALAALGYGLAAFGRANLQVVSDTVSHSFGRAFVTGLVGQILILPTFGMLVVGLILSVAGILLLPFAVVVYALLVIVGVVGGYLAVAHAMGEAYTRKRLAQGVLLGTPSSYGFLFSGLAATMALWAAWAAFGWVPLAGDLIRGAAILVTWLLGTAGLGAAMLSRAGIRENFAGRIIPPEALTDEYLWATPQYGVPAAKRPGASTRTGPGV